jgi:hypothetical protein
MRVVSHLSQAGVAGSSCSHRGHASFWVSRVKIANIDTSRGSLERRASAILSRVRSSAAGKLNLGLQALVYVPSTATQDRKRKPATGRRPGWSRHSCPQPAAGLGHAGTRFRARRRRAISRRLEGSGSTDQPHGRRHPVSPQPYG